jgi:hypothetical protein
MLSVKGATLTFSFGKVPLQTLNMDFGLKPSLDNLPGASMYAQTRCASIPNYGASTFATGLCNTGGNLAAAGTFITDPYSFPGHAPAQIQPPNVRPRGLRVSSVSLQRPAAATDGSVTVKLALAAGASYPARDHRVGVLLVDPSGQPLGIDYTAQTTVTNGAGNLTGVRLTIPKGTLMPAHLRAYVMTDVFPLAERKLY